MILFLFGPLKKILGQIRFQNEEEVVSAVYFDGKCTAYFRGDVFELLWNGDYVET